MSTILPAVRIAHPHVDVRADVLGGSPHVRGTRVPVRRLWAWHRRGVSVETLLKRYPALGPSRVLDALSFAFDNEDLVLADLAREDALMGTDSEAVPGAMAQERLPFKND
ncbi:MAG: DUF433 domain-containing protein [Polyangiaceae bacterium]